MHVLPGQWWVGLSVSEEPYPILRKIMDIDLTSNYPIRYASFSSKGDQFKSHHGHTFEIWENQIGPFHLQIISEEQALCLLRIWGYSV